MFDWSELIPPEKRKQLVTEMYRTEQGTTSVHTSNGNTPVIMKNKGNAGEDKQLAPKIDNTRSSTVQTVSNTPLIGVKNKPLGDQASAGIIKRNQETEVNGPKAPEVTGNTTIKQPKDELLPMAPTHAGQEITTSLSKYTAKDPETGFQVVLPKPISELTLSDEGFEFIKKHEGYMGYVYNDLKTGADGKRTHWYDETDHKKYDAKGNVTGTGTPTIGYGYVLNQQELAAEKWKDKELTKPEADEQLKEKVAPYVQAVKNLMKGSMFQWEFDATVSFTYNVGKEHKPKNKGGLPDSKFLEEWNKNGRYNYTTGAYTADLMLHYQSPAIIIGRRKAEVKLFKTGAYK